MKQAFVLLFVLLGFAPTALATSPLPVDELITGTACPANYAPVCGTDGKTYPNKCMASAAKVQVVRNAECDAPVIDPARPPKAATSTASTTTPRPAVQNVRVQTALNRTIRLLESAIDRGDAYIERIGARAGTDQSSLTDAQSELDQARLVLAELQTSTDQKKSRALIHIVNQHLHDALAYFRDALKNQNQNERFLDTKNR